VKGYVTVGKADFYVEIYGTASKTLVFFHGFSQTHETFYPLLQNLKTYKVVLVDLLGHGKTRDEYESYSFELLVTLLEALFEKLGLFTFDLYGYSMGARVAMHFCRSYPQRVEHLLLESSSAGLKSYEEVESRVIQDQNVESKIIEGLEQFNEFWKSLPLFSRLKNLSIEKQENIERMRLSQNPKNLIKALKGFSIARQKNLLEEFQFKQICLIAGKEDLKYCQIMQEMAHKWSAPLVCVENAGHNVHIEHPLEIVEIIQNISVKSKMI